MRLRLGVADAAMVTVNAGVVVGVWAVVMGRDVMRWDGDKGRKLDTVER